MKKKRWIIMIIAIILILTCIWWYFWYKNNKLRWYNETCDSSWADDCLWGGSNRNKRRECSDYLKQRYECQWFKNLDAIYKSKWYKQKYQECYDSYYGFFCGIPEEMCGITRLVSGKFCE